VALFSESAGRALVAIPRGHETAFLALLDEQRLPYTPIGMVGVGPFLTIPFMVAAMGGPDVVYAWAFGALLALCDGLVYAELGAALPGSGGPYVYLREAYRPFGLGRLMAFVFIFQIVLVAPLAIAGGAVGFADYLGFYWTTMSPLEHNLVATSARSAASRSSCSSSRSGRSRG